MSASPTTGQATSPAALSIPLLPGNQRIAWSLVLGGWAIVGVGYFLSLSHGGTLSSLSGESPRLLVFAVGSSGIWAILTPLVLGLIRHPTVAGGRWERRAGFYVLIATAFLVVSGTLEELLALGIGIRDSIGSGWLYRSIETRLTAFFAIVALGWSARYFALYRTRHLHASDLETRLAKTHLQVLKMQLQPHFLFNTLNTVAELVHTDPEAADQMITRLGRLLRLSLDHASHQVVPLRQEADFLRVYLDIEQVRFQDRLQVVWDLAPDTLDSAVPTLLWQPVLENAIRHGVTPLAGRGRVVIASRRVAEDLVLDIRDNGLGLPPGGVPREGVGLRNVRERLTQLYGPRARFSLAPALGGGTLAVLQLPFIHCEAPHTPVPLPGSDLEEVVR